MLPDFIEITEFSSKASCITEQKELCVRGPKVSSLLCMPFRLRPYLLCRCLRLGTYGLLLDGPIGHWWYTVLDANVEPDDSRSTKAVLIKTAADQLIWAPVMTCVFFAVLRSLEGHPELILPTIQVQHTALQAPKTP